VQQNGWMFAFKVMVSTEQSAESIRNCVWKKPTSQLM